jgi:hypothetical protein
MYPHERSLVKRLEGKPFALIGINSDQDREQLKKSMEQENITWRSFWDGGSTSGPIASKWNVRAWPTIYVLDANGTVRYKNVRGPAMDVAVNTLLKEMGVTVEVESAEPIEAKPQEAKKAAAKPAQAKAIQKKSKAADKTGATTPAAAYRALVAEYNKAQQDFSTAYRAAKTQEERQKLYQSSYPNPQKYAGRFLELATKNPKDPVALDAAIWVVTSAGYTPAASQAVDIILRDFVDSPKLGPVCQSLADSPSPSAEKLLRTVLDKNQNREVQAYACFSLGQLLKGRSGSKAAATESENLFEQVVARYGDIKSYRGSLKDAANRELFELRNLAIGKTAPQIEGEDIDGVKFKLSDYRGKVVVLDFWGHW